MQSPAVLLFAFNRPRYLLETLRSLSAQEQLPKFAVYVSQDGAGETAQHTQWCCPEYSGSKQIIPLSRLRRVV
jgi:hypothetical protein